MNHFLRIYVRVHINYKLYAESVAIFPVIASISSKDFIGQAAGFSFNSVVVWQSFLATTSAMISIVFFCAGCCSIIIKSKDKLRVSGGVSTAFVRIAPAL